MNLNVFRFKPWLAILFYGLVFAVSSALAQTVAELTAEAEQGHARAQVNLGIMYAYGEGVPEDDATAVMWYTKAAEQGHARAQYNLGFMYAYGEGVPKDHVSAYMWWNLAAALGNEGAKNNKEMFAGRMTREDISKAQALSRECLAQDYKNCGY